MDTVQPFLVDGQWRLNRAGRTFESINPSNGRIAAIIAESDDADVADAVRAAGIALGRADWGGLPAHRRARLLHRLGNAIEENSGALAALQTADNGKTLAESLWQARWAAEMFHYYAAVCETFESAVVPPRGDYLSFTLHEPVGVVAAITPWNSPISLEAQKLAPALAAGNTVVLKSSDVTPQIGLAYARLALEVGFPAGVLNVVTGGPAVGRALIANPGVSMITFTGGAVGGRAVAAAAAERMIPAVLELGGKSPNIVFDDADLDNAVVGAAYGIFSNAGQSCIAGSRIFVQASIYDAFVTRLVEAATSLVVGAPDDPATAIAPLSSFGHRDRVESMVAEAVANGSRVLAGGARPTGASFDGGAYFQPTVLDVPSNRCRIAQEEIFGPVACLIRFVDEADLIAQANDTVFGLACGVWTENYRRALRIARAIKAGMVWINTYKAAPVNMPFGGVKQSGIGRECGLEGLMPYLQEKSVYMNLAEGPHPWPPGRAT